MGKILPFVRRCIVMGGEAGTVKSPRHVQCVIVVVMMQYRGRASNANVVELMLDMNVNARRM